MNDYYATWSENELRNGLWYLANNRTIPGGFTDPQELRAELERRGLSTEGYHGT